MRLVARVLQAPATVGARRRHPPHRGDRAGPATAHRRAAPGALVVIEPGALADLAVLDLSNLFAAPLVSTILGDFGARVVKVEPPGGDPLRRMGVARDGRSLMWAFVNRNKQAITLDLDTEAGRELLGR